MQHRAIKLVLGMENKAYSGRLEELKLPSLEYRRKRADVMQTYKIMNNIDSWAEMRGVLCFHMQGVYGGDKVGWRSRRP